jgi:hypothetical protein
MTNIRYVYQEASPKLAGKAREFGKNYRRMAVLEVDADILPTDAPKMISERAKGVIQIIEDVVYYIGETRESKGFRERERLQALTLLLNLELAEK